MVPFPLPPCTEPESDTATRFWALERLLNRANLMLLIVSFTFSCYKRQLTCRSDKKTKAIFDLFIKGSNSLVGEISKARAATENKLEADILAAAKAKDAGKLKAAYDEFIKVADLVPEFKDGELGQTDSSGYSPTWGTSRQYIYQR